MDQDTLVIEEKDAGKEFIDQFSKAWPVQVAFWVKPTEGSTWHLYVAAKGIDDSNISDGYGEVFRLASGMRTPYLDPFQIKLAKTDNPLAQAVMDIHRRYPGLLALNYRKPNLGLMSIDGAYLYPLSGTAAAQP